ncbi:hypothetical protein J8273_3730 [Carpediemonas membranifera]|uniref:Uncharacterized protein n=1 Tax=Carpediemonas membranifera TaxID=201153 RepID=A0A8J6B7J5_9EUKA|nr:hypothetical protein J8273_3730 [Carpediemonas membranifera]|eukprot:KAG9394754.1 hypothetical protein J8273_3730 [Carpediemonas membranifera]
MSSPQPDCRRNSLQNPSEPDQSQWKPLPLLHRSVPATPMPSQWMDRSERTGMECELLSSVDLSTASQASPFALNPIIPGIGVSNVDSELEIQQYFNNDGVPILPSALTIGMQSPFEVPSPRGSSTMPSTPTSGRLDGVKRAGRTPRRGGKTVSISRHTSPFTMPRTAPSSDAVKVRLHMASPFRQNRVSAETIRLD